MLAELDTFVFKFKHLWKSGVDAHFDIDSHAKLVLKKQTVLFQQR